MAKLAKKEKGGALVDASMFKEDAQKGLEGADKDSFAIPFLKILQPMSPEVTEESVDGAKAGLFINSVSQALHQEVVVIPVAFSRRFVQWTPRDQGGGMVGQFTKSEVEDKVKAGDFVRDGRDIVPKDGTMLKDTRYHYVLMLEDNQWQQAIIAMDSTQIKRSKRWMSMISQWKMTLHGETFNPPSYARRYILSSEKEKNDKGTWHSFIVSAGDDIEEKALYQMAKDFNAQISAGNVEVKYEKQENTDEGF